MRRTTFTIAAAVLLYSTASAGPVAIYAPKPQYTQFAAVHHIEADGLFVMRVQIRSGLVKDVQVARSTGWAGLDAAAIRALKEWRSKPGSCPPIKVEQPWRKDAFATEDSFVKLPVHFRMNH
jgi:TonB family protein